LLFPPVLPPFGKEDDVSLKKPFGRKASAYLDKIMRRMRVKDITRLARTNRPAAIGIVVVCVLATAMLFASLQSSAHNLKPAPHTEAVTPASDPTPEPAAAKSTRAVTITGCLERDDETFRLKNAEGAEAPKSRSWKTGFLKKSSASIEVVDAAKRLKLTNYVGQRVSVTGVLVEREMQARTLRRVSNSCSDKPTKSEASE
jgi:hypothetical protein